MPAPASVSFSGEYTRSLDQEGALGFAQVSSLLEALHKASPPSSTGQASLLRVPMVPSAQCTFYLVLCGLTVFPFVFFSPCLAHTRDSSKSYHSSYIFSLALKFTKVGHGRSLTKGERSVVGGLVVKLLQWVWVGRDDRLVNELSQ